MSPSDEIEPPDRPGDDEAPTIRPRQAQKRLDAKAALARHDLNDPSLQLDRKLTQEELDICQSVVVFGVDWLRQTKGMTAFAIKEFLNRFEVKRELDALKRAYEDRTGIQERTQFFANAKINAMVPAAVNTLARALRGSYQDPNTGQTVQAPTKSQYDAAIEVLNRANIQGSKFAGNDSVPAIDDKAVRAAIGASSGMLDGLSADGREKIRKVLAGVISRTRALTAAEQRNAARHAEPPVQPAGADGDD